MHFLVKILVDKKNLNLLGIFTGLSKPAVVLIG
jgi:hypothetical protein